MSMLAQSWVDQRTQHEWCFKQILEISCDFQTKGAPQKVMLMSIVVGNGDLHSCSRRMNTRRMNSRRNTPDADAPDEFWLHLSMSQWSTSLQLASSPPVSAVMSLQRESMVMIQQVHRSKAKDKQSFCESSGALSTVCQNFRRKNKME